MSTYGASARTVSTVSYPPVLYTTGSASPPARAASSAGSTHGSHCVARDQVDVFRALLLQFQEDLRQPPGADIPPRALLADRVVLAVAAPQRAAAEKHRAAAGGGLRVAAQARLLPVVQRGARGPQHVSRAAHAGLPPRRGLPRRRGGTGYNAWAGLAWAAAWRLPPAVKFASKRARGPLSLQTV